MGVVDWREKTVYAFFCNTAVDLKLINDCSDIDFFEVSAQHSDWSGALVQNTPTQFDATPLHPAD